jgi:hypothetical protein
MKRGIILLTHPNTNKKLDLLKSCIKILSKTNIPIFVFANMEISSDITEGATFIHAGDNKMYAASDFLSLDKIKEARNLTKYRLYLNISDESSIIYFPINYGTEKNYYWSCIKLYKVAFNYMRLNGFTHFMLSQYDNLIGDSSLELVNSYLDDLELYNLDGDFPVDKGMGDNHLNGDVFFGKVDWWDDLFSTMYPEDFYKVSFPNWTPEEYYFLKAKEKGGKIKIRLKKTESYPNFYNNLPENWIKQEQESDLNLPVNLYFSDIIGNGLSDNTNTENFDINKSLIISVLPKNDYYELFLFNKCVSLNPKTINIDIKIKKDDIVLYDINIDLNPGNWVLRHIYEDIRGSNLESITKYTVDEKKVYLI